MFVSVEKTNGGVPFWVLIEDGGHVLSEKPQEVAAKKMAAC